MGSLARCASLLRNLFCRARIERELDEEMRAYVGLLASEKMAAGLSPDAALRAARMEAGAEQVKEQVRDVRAGALVGQCAADIRYGVRVLRRNPGFAIIAMLTLALGIGATTAIFSVVHGVLLRPLPYDRADRILHLDEVSAKGTRMRLADPNFEDLQAQNRTLRAMAEYSSWLTPVSGPSQPSRTMVARVSREFLPILGVRVVRGRDFAADDHRVGAPLVALVSEGYWRRCLGGAADLSPFTLLVERQPAAVIGVLPAGFRFPDDSEIWVPRASMPRWPSRTAHNWQAIGRLRDGASLAQARADLSAIAARLKRENGKDTMMEDVAAVPLQEHLTGRARPALLILFGAVGFLLLIACANVVNLLFAQAAGRTREVAVRAALGAGRNRLVRQFLAEALLLALSGGAVGVLAAMAGLRALVALAPHDLPRLDNVAVNVPVLLFALGVSVIVACGLGVLTAVLGTSGDLRRPLAEGGRGQAGGARAQRLARLVIAAQLAITLVLLVGAGLLGQSLLRVLSVHPGFQTDHVLSMDLALPPVEPPDAARGRVQFLDGLIARLRLIPGVRDVGVTTALPLTESYLADGLYVLMAPQERQPELRDLERLWHDPARTGDADYAVASEGFFRAVGIPLRRGRLFDGRDTVDAPHAAVISESLAREKFGGQDPLGRQLEFGNMDGDLRLLTIVGVVGDVHGGSLETPPRPTVYVDYRQRPRTTTSITIVMRADAAPAPVFASAREIVRALDATVPATFGTFSQIFSASLDARRFNLTLITVFACAALLLAMAGIYGVTAYAVARSTQEIGVRMALGASAGDVLRLVLGQGLLTAAGGLAVGVVGSLALTGTLRSLLFAVKPTDPITLAGVVLLLAAVVLVASYIPARRATRVHPIAALRTE